jgi:recombinational DNA repair protein RecR
MTEVGERAEANALSLHAFGESDKTELFSTLRKLHSDQSSCSCARLLPRASLSEKCTEPAKEAKGRESASV